jgi:thymidylate synthase (FAD)
VIARLAARSASSGGGPASHDEFLACQDPTWSGLARSRERDECREKLIRLGLVADDEPVSVVAPNSASGDASASR